MDTSPNDCEFEYWLKHGKELDLKLVGTKAYTYDAETKTSWTGTYMLNEDGELYVQPDSEPVKKHEPIDTLELLNRWSNLLFKERE